MPISARPKATPNRAFLWHSTISRSRCRSRCEKDDPCTANADRLPGTPEDDLISGLGANDTLIGLAGNDLLDGGDGVDLALFSGGLEQYRIGLRDGVMIVDGPDGQDQLTSVEMLGFGDAPPLAAAALGRGAEALALVHSGGVTLHVMPSIYSGPVAWLDVSLLGSVAGDLILGTDRNDFFNLLGGDDAVDAGAGADVIDGGTGSNFLTGGAGRDDFFLDGRGGTSTWSTITDWEAGERLSLFGWQLGMSRAIWVDRDGAAGFQGVTLHADLDGNGLIDTSVTWTGRARDDLPTALELDGLLWFVPPATANNLVAADDRMDVSRGHANFAREVLTANDSDPEGDGFGIAAVATGRTTHGSLAYANGRLEYQADAGYSGPDSFTYTIADSRGATASATVTLDVHAGNRAPLASDLLAYVVRDGSLAGQLRGEDPDGPAPIFVLRGGPARGSLELAADGGFRFTPGTDFAALTAGQTAEARFTFITRDAEGLESAEATARITVLAGAARTGTDSADILTGGDGATLFTPGPGDDRVTGGGGADVFQLGLDAGQDQLDGGPGRDTLLVEADDLGARLSLTLSAVGTLLLQGDARAEIRGIEEVVLDGGDGADQLTAAGDLARAGVARSTIRLNGNGGADELDASGLVGEPPVRAVIRGGDGRDTLRGGAGDDELFGERDGDSLEGGMGRDLLDGGPGNDTLLGGADGDTIEGGDGQDRLDGGEGDDVLRGGRGSDTLLGGAGQDRALFDGARADYTISVIGDVTYVVGAQNSAQLQGVESILFGGENRAPLPAQAFAPIAAPERSPFAFTLPLTGFSDPDGDPLTLSVLRADGTALPAWLGSAGGRLEGMPGRPDLGVLNLKVVATDGFGATAEAPLQLTITQVNLPPVVAAPLADRFAQAGQAFSLTIPTGAFTDPDNDLLGFSAEGMAGWLGFDAATRRFSGTAPVDGTGGFDVRVSATDPSGETVADVFRVTLNRAPVAVADAAEGNENTDLRVTVLANDGDPDGDRPRVGAIAGTLVEPGDVVRVGGVLVVLNEDGSLGILPDEEVNDTLVIPVTVFDGRGGEATSDLTVTLRGIATPARLSFGEYAVQRVDLAAAQLQVSWYPEEYGDDVAISGDGRYVAFVAKPLSLLPGFGEGVQSDIYLLDRTTGDIRRVSTHSAGEPFVGNSGDPELSADGRYMVFSSKAVPAPGIGSPYNNIYLKDLVTGTVNWIDFNPDYYVVRDSQISADGTVVAGNKYGGFLEVYVTKNLVTGAIGGGSHNFISDPRLSGDGSRLVYDGYDYNRFGTLPFPLGPFDNTNQIYLVDNVTNERVLVSAGGGGLIKPDGESYSPAISSDGLRIAYATNSTTIVPGTPIGTSQVIVYDTFTLQQRAASVTKDGVFDNSGKLSASRDVEISGDGRFVAFTSSANNLVPGTREVTGFPGYSDTNLYLKDMNTGDLLRLSTAIDGLGGNSSTFNFDMDLGGNTVAFRSTASNLVTGDTNNYWDLFIAVRDTFRGYEDGPPIAIPVEALPGAKGEQVIRTALTGFPEGFTLSAGTPEAAGFAWVFDGPPPRDLTFRAPRDWNGSFTMNVLVTTRDGGDTTTATASKLVTVFPVADTPEAADDAATILENTEATIAVLANDRDGDGDTLFVAKIAGAAIAQGETRDVGDGTVTLLANGRLLVRPDNEFSGTLRFTYAAGDSTGREGTAEVRVNVIPVAQPARIDAPQLASGTPYGISGNRDAFSPVVSANGSTIAFITDATDLAPVGSYTYSGAPYFLLRGPTTGPFFPLTPPDSQAAAPGINLSPSISREGSRVAFQSNVAILVNGDTNATHDIFLATGPGAITRVSVNASGQQANGMSYEPALAADGGFVAFMSEATNLVLGDTNGRADLFVKNLSTGAVTLVADPQQRGNADLSADGRFLAYDSNARDPYRPSDTDGVYDVMVADLVRGGAMRASSNAAGEAANGPSTDASVSTTGRYVAFTAVADNLVPGVSGKQIYRKDMLTGEVRLASASAEGVPANNNTFYGKISGDGRFVAFSSLATNLVAEDSDDRVDVYVKDMLSGALVVVSIEPGGVRRLDDAYVTAISANGGVLTYVSSVSRLGPLNTNPTDDVVVVSLARPMIATEDGPAIPLPIAVSPGSAGETLQQVVISGLPVGSLLSAGTPSGAGTVWSFAGSPPADLTFIPPPDTSGAFTLTITATTADSGDTEVISVTRVLQIRAVDDGPPVLATPILDQVAGTRQAFTFTLPSTTFADPDGTPMVLDAQRADGTALPAWLRFDAGTGRFSGTPALGNVGPVDVRVTATDEFMGFVSDVFRIDVQLVNAAPVLANPLPDQDGFVEYYVGVGVPVNTFSDADGEALTSSRLRKFVFPNWL